MEYLQKGSIEGWIDVRCMLPEQNEYVLLYDSSLELVYEGKLLPSDFYYSDRSGYSKDIGDGCEITHWMPLPKPPNDHQ
jgi:hypothetical protein